MMYKSYTAADYREALGLPPDYVVAGAVVHGTGRKKRPVGLLNEVTEDLGVPVEYECVHEDGFFENVTVLNISGQRIWFDTVYGGAYLSELLHITALFGAKKHILIGSCGGLKPGATAGDVVVPRASYGDESSTRMYQANQSSGLYPANDNLSAALEKRLVSEFTLLDGPMMTCQAMMAETWDDVQHWSAAGYVGVDMETSTVFAISNHFGVPAAAMLYIADNLIERESFMDAAVQQMRSRREEIRRRLFHIAFQEVIV